MFDGFTSAQVYTKVGSGGRGSILGRSLKMNIIKFVFEIFSDLRVRRGLEPYLPVFIEVDARFITSLSLASSVQQVVRPQQLHKSLLNHIPDKQTKKNTPKSQSCVGM